MSFADPANPFKTLEIRGTTEIEPDLDYAFASRVGAKYGVGDMREMVKPGQSRAVVTIIAEKAHPFGQ